MTGLVSDQHCTYSSCQCIASTLSPCLTVTYSTRHHLQSLTSLTYADPNVEGATRGSFHFQHLGFKDSPRLRGSSNNIFAQFYVDYIFFIVKIQFITTSDVV